MSEANSVVSEVSSRHPLQRVEELPLKVLLAAEMPVVRGMLKATVVLVSVILVCFGVRDWVLSPDVATWTTALRVSIIPVAWLAYRAMDGEDLQAYRAGMVFVYAVIGAFGAVLAVLPNGVMHYGVALEIIPLGATMFLPRMRDLIWVQLWLIGWVQVGVVVGDLPRADVVGIEGGLAISQAVTYMLGSFAIRSRHERIRLEAQLRKAADRDALTGVFNRRHIEAAGTTEVSRARRYRRPLSVIVMDIDHFKRVNDTFGHAIGDEVICATTRLLERATRDSDVVGRLGGEEFIVILPETDGASAMILADRLRQAIAAASVATSIGPVRWTVSCGVEAMSSTDPDLAELLRRADRALYAAKGAGRNCVRLGTQARPAGAEADGAVPVELPERAPSVRLLRGIAGPTGTTPPGGVET